MRKRKWRKEREKEIFASRKWRVNEKMYEWSERMRERENYDEGDGKKRKKPER